MRSQDYHIFISPLPTAKIITLVDKVLVTNGLLIEANGNSSIRLYDYEIEEDEFYFTTESITNPIADLEKLKANPSGGCIAYQYFSSDVLVSFNIVDSDLYTIDTISISFHFQIYQLHQERIDRLIQMLHQTTNAIRTIGGESISEDTDLEKEVLVNTKAGILKKQYSVDLR